MPILYIKRVLLFLLPIALLTAHLETGLRGMENSYTFKSKGLTRSGKQLKTLVLGNSQALKGINPGVLDGNLQPAFNMANVSQTLYYDSTILANNLNRLPRLKNVILTLCYTSLYEELWEIEPFRPFFYARFMDIPGQGTENFGLMRFSQVALYSAKTSLNLALKGFPNQTEGLDSNGFQKAEKREISPALSARRIREHLKGIKKSHFLPNLNRLKSIVWLCQKHSIQLILVVMPVHKTYYTLESPEFAGPFHEVLNNLKHQSGVTVLNLEQSPLPDTCFADQDHLSWAGSIWLGKTINSHPKQ